MQLSLTLLRINIPPLINLLVVVPLLVVQPPPPQLRLLILILVEVLVHLLSLLVDPISVVQLLLRPSSSLRVQLDVLPVHTLALVVVELINAAVVPLCVLNEVFTLLLALGNN
jgi:hypothetical protein